MPEGSDPGPSRLPGATGRGRGCGCQRAAPRIASAIPAAPGPVDGHPLRRRRCAVGVRSTSGCECRSEPRSSDGGARRRWELHGRRRGGGSSQAAKCARRARLGEGGNFVEERLGTALHPVEVRLLDLRGHGHDVSSATATFSARQSPAISVTSFEPTPRYAGASGRVRRRRVCQWRSRRRDPA